MPGPVGARGRGGCSFRGEDAEQVAVVTGGSRGRRPWLLGHWSNHAAGRLRVRAPLPGPGPPVSLVSGVVVLRVFFPVGERKRG